MAAEMKSCPSCDSPYGYSLASDAYKCPACDFEWNPNESLKPTPILKIKEMMETFSFCFLVENI